MAFFESVLGVSLDGGNGIAEACVIAAMVVTGLILYVRRVNRPTLA